MGNKYYDINRLIDIINVGGRLKTGINIYNKQKKLVLDANTNVTSTDSLRIMKSNGITCLLIQRSGGGGVWDKNGIEILSPEAVPTKIEGVLDKPTNLEESIKNIFEIRKEAGIKFEKAKSCITKVLSDIKETGGEFDYGEVEETVSELLDFMNKDESAFSLMTKEIFSYDDYLYNHSTNVCTIATPVIKRFIEKFGKETGCDYPERLQDISIGYFLHDIGKVLLPDEILNKKGELTDEEFEIVKTHSFELGLRVFEKNKITNRFILDSAEFHHANVYKDEGRCYPAKKTPKEIPPYVKVCKMADIYDAMTSKRCYKEAFNPINVVSNLYKQYSEKNRTLQLVLHSFVSVVGIYPPGSIVSLTNGQLAYIISSKGPIVIPFTDSKTKSMLKLVDPIDLLDQGQSDNELKINHNRPIMSPKQVYDKLPKHLKEIFLKYQLAGN